MIFWRFDRRCYLLRRIGSGRSGGDKRTEEVIEISSVVTVVFIQIIQSQRTQLVTPLRSRRNGRISPPSSRLISLIFV